MERGLERDLVESGGVGNKEDVIQSGGEEDGKGKGCARKALGIVKERHEESYIASRKPFASCGEESCGTLASIG